MYYSNIPHDMVTTTFSIEGHRVIKTLGLSRGVIVRSCSIFGSVGASIQTIFGGNITLFEELCEQTLEQVYDRMYQHAIEMGANAIIGMRYDATEVMNGVTEVLTYGTAVVVEKE